jgi:mono/diheme cytochrome c family protein
VATGPGPAADPPAAPPAAVANRQPAARAAQPARAAAPPVRSAVLASDIARPEAAQETAPELQAQPAAASATDLAAGRKLFADWSCGACHRLADASASGSIGPSLDSNPRLTVPYARETIHDGRGAMPSFAGQISDPDIARLASYIVQASRK